VEGELGHYVLWLPSSTADRIDTWTGPGGVQYVSADEFWQRSTGTVLLTSPEPIARLEDAVTNIRPTNNWLALLAIGMAPVVGLGLCCHRTIILNRERSK
jgi:hypothetical protein